MNIENHRNRFVGPAVSVRVGMRWESQVRDKFQAVAGSYRYRMHLVQWFAIEVRACCEYLLDTARVPVKCKIGPGVLRAVADDCPQLIVLRLREYGNVSRQILPQ